VKAVREREWQKAAENCAIKSFQVLSFIKYYYDYQIKQDDTGGQVIRIQKIEKCLRNS
jgi:hypothetical protein